MARTCRICVIGLSAGTARVSRYLCRMYFLHCPRLRVGDVCSSHEVPLHQEYSKQLSYTKLPRPLRSYVFVGWEGCVVVVRF